ncbi:MAG: CoA transferase [Dehalococcoidia bacterium]|nr:CoA transferase [Dehalococcoidia bacterium]
MSEGALSHLRICDFTGQLAGAGATRFLAAFGAQIIRIEDPVTEGRWDILRGNPPYKPGQRGLEYGGAYNNHNVEKLGITLNLRTDRGKEILRDLVRISDAVTENFAAGVLERWGFNYEGLKAIRPDIIYVSNCGFGHSGPYRDFKTWGPIVQAVSGLTFSSGIPDQPPAGWGYSYMDHTGAYFMAMAIMMALHHRNVTGEGQWVDLACTEAACTLNGPALLDATVNGRPLRRPGMPDANRSQFPPMAPHNIYAAAGEDNWVAVACRNDGEWATLRQFIGERWASDPRFDRISGRLEWQDELDANMTAFTSARDRFTLAESIRALGIPATAVQRPEERIDKDPNTEGWGLWPTVQHTLMGEVRVDGLPVHLSETDWHLERGGPCLGEHNEQVYGEVLGMSSREIAGLRAEGVI